MSLLPLSALANWHNDSQAIMGTEVRVSLWQTDAEKAQRLIEGVFDIMRGVDSRLSPYKPESDLSRLNALAAKKPVLVSSEIERLLLQSQWAYAISDGAFDITFASVGRFYDYRKKVLPSADKIASILPALSTQHLKFDSRNKTLHFLNPKVTIDFGGIAKGYAVDLAIDYLVAQGVANAYVSAGGDSRALGNRGDRPWFIGIKNPRMDNGQAETVLTLPLENVAVSTSGDYERFFIDPTTGKRVHHIINPKSGTSATGVMSATVIGPSGLMTDPLSTAIFVLGVEAGIKLINRLDDIDAVMIDSTGQVHFSNGLMPQS